MRAAPKRGGGGRMGACRFSFEGVEKGRKLPACVLMKGVQLWLWLAVGLWAVKSAQL